METAMHIRVEAPDKQLKKVKVGDTVTVTIRGKVHGMELKTEAKDHGDYESPAYPGHVTFEDKPEVRIKKSTDYDEMFKDEDD
jgi:hypothetical protein